MFKNLTPHTINLYSQDKKEKVMEISSVGSIRIQEKRIPQENIEGFPSFSVEFMSPEISLKEGTAPITPTDILVVSAIAGHKVKELFPLNRVVSPDTSAGAVRNEKGMILGTTAFIEY